MEKKSRHHKFILFFLPLIVLFLFFLLHVTPVTDSFIVELGDPVPQDLQQYIQTSKWMRQRSTLDLSQVKTDQVGSYSATVQAGRKSFRYTITIQDTTPPSITPVADGSCFAMNRMISADSFFEDYSDLSGPVYLFCGQEKNICFTAPGEEILTLVARDASGNESRAQVRVIAEHAPLIFGCLNKTGVLGATDTTFLYDVIAADEEDGIISDRVRADTSQVNFLQEGEYPIFYTVTDSCGVDTRVEGSVYVYAFGSDTPHYEQSGYSLSSEQLSLLCRSGYFTYEALAGNTDRDAVLELVKPICANIGFSNSFGSGFVYKIEEDYTYILTAAHVQLSEWPTISFADDVIFSAKAARADAKPGSECALYRIETSSIPVPTLLHLKEALIALSIYDSIQPDASLLLYSENWGFDAPFKPQIRNVKLVNIAEPGPMTKYLSDSYILAQGTAVGGMSGCPVLDYEGHILGLTSAIRTTRPDVLITRLDRLPQVMEKLAA